MPEISHTAQDLADFRASMDQHTIALKNHKITLEEFQTLVCYSKLPPTLRSVFRRDLGADCMNYQVFADKVTSELANLKLSERVSSGTTFKKQPLSSIATFKVQSAMGQKSPKQYLMNAICVFCNNQHRWIKCPQFTSPEARLGKVNSLGLCTLCLQSDHSAQRCPVLTRYRCVHEDCHLRVSHNVALCGKSAPSMYKSNTSQKTHGLKSKSTTHPGAQNKSSKSTQGGGL